MKGRAGAIAILVGLFALIAVAPAHSSEHDSAGESDGGLDVSGGGSFGYIGGSGSPQGTIRGPGASKQAPAAEADGTPSAVGGGVIEKAPAGDRAEDASLEAEPTSGAEMGTVSWIVVAVMLLGAVWLFRKLPKRA